MNPTLLKKKTHLEVEPSMEAANSSTRCDQILVQSPEIDEEET